MRICLVTSELAPFRGWGVGTSTGELAKALRDAGHEIHLLVDDLPGVRERGGSVFPGVRIHILERSDFAGALSQYPCECTRRPLTVHRRLAELHARHRFDCIEFNDFFGDAYFALEARRASGAYAGAVTVVHLHSPIFLLRHVNRQPEFDLDIAVITHMETSVLRSADLLISPSRAMIDKLSELEGLGEVMRGTGPGPRVEVIPYAYDRASLTGDEAESTAPGRPEVLFFGRLETRKGPEVLVDAAQRLFEQGLDFGVRIVGEDTDCGPGRRSMREHLRRRIDPRWRDRFEFMENQPRESVVRLIRRATACCFPALWDNYPNACLEAMLLGAPVIASAAGGMSEMIEHGRSGLLVPAGDAGGLGAAIRAVVSDAEIRARIGACAAVRARTLCEPAGVADRHIEALRAARPRESVRVPESGDTVSVVVPVYNLGETLPLTLASIRGQTRPPEEIIVVDDGSTDERTRGVLQRIDIAGTRVIRQTNRGLPAARNRGIRESRGRWVLPLDADDLLAPAFVERCLEAAARVPEAALVTSHMACFRESPEHPEIAFIPFGFPGDILPAVNIASSAIAMLRRESVVGVGGYDETMTAYEDWELYCRMASAGLVAVVIPEPLILNRIRPDSMLRSMSHDEDLHLRARVLERHLGLSRRPDRTARIVLARAGARPANADAREVARAMVQENLRYRLADRAHAAIKALGVKAVVKKALLRAEGSDGAA